MRGIVALRRLRAVLAAAASRDRRGARQRAAARAPARSPPTTRTPRRWASRPPASRCAAAPDGDARPTLVLRHRRRRPTSTRPTPPRSTPRCGSTRGRRALDFGGAVALGGRRAARSRSTATGARRSCVAADIRTGLPGGADERDGGDGAAALARRRRRRRPGARRAPRRAARRPRSSSTAGARRATTARSVWEERFGETPYVPLAEQAVDRRARRRPASPPTRSTTLIVTGTARPRRAARRRAARRRARRRSPTTSPPTVGNTGAAHAGAAARRRARAGRAGPGRSRSSSLADGADVLLFRTTDALAAYRAGARRCASRSTPARDDLPYAQVPHVARLARPRAAAPARARPRRRRPPSLPHRGLEVRLRRHRVHASAAPCTCRRRGCA